MKRVRGSGSNVFSFGWCIYVFVNVVLSMLGWRHEVETTILYSARAIPISLTTEKRCHTKLIVYMHTKHVILVYNSRQRYYWRF